MIDGRHILRRQAGARLEPHQHAGFGRLLRLEKHRVLGKGQMDARLLDLGQRHHGALQFAFQRAPVIHVFGEFGGAEIHFVEQLEADAAGLGQADGGHGQPQFGQPRGGHQHRAAAFGQAVFGAGFLQFLHDAGGVFRRQAREQRPEIGFLLPLHQRVQPAADRDRHHQDGDPLPRAEIRQNLVHDFEGAPQAPKQ